MRVRLTKVDEHQFLTCIKHSVWGSNSARFKDWQIGDFLVFTVNKAVAGLAEVSGAPYTAQTIIWDHGTFPFRIGINFTHIFLSANRLPISGEIRDVLIQTWGTTYGWGIRDQRLLEGSAADLIIETIQDRVNDHTRMISDLDRLLIEAKSHSNSVES